MNLVILGESKANWEPRTLKGRKPWQAEWMAVHKAVPLTPGICPVLLPSWPSSQLMEQGGGVPTTSSLGPENPVLLRPLCSQKRSQGLRGSCGDGAPACTGNQD